MMLIALRVSSWELGSGVVGLIYYEILEGTEAGGKMPLLMFVLAFASVALGGAVIYFGNSPILFELSVLSFPDCFDSLY